MALAAYALRNAMILAGAAFLAQAPAPAFAQDRRGYDIPGQPLAEALRQFSRASDRNLLFSSDLVRDLTSSPVSGTFSDTEVLARLLAGTGLSFEETPSGALALRAAAGAASTAESAPRRSRLPYTGPAGAPIGGAHEEIVVTGSRILRAGFESPTPVSSLGVNELQTMAYPNIADAVNRLPVVQGSVSPMNSETSFSSGTGGVNQLDLRNLQPLRTLVLLDGKRISGASLSGFDNNGNAVDVNAIPGDLVARVDIVTGGASAAYGSDALAGVVNFVLDTSFTGVRGSLESGITTYGDNETYKIALTAGRPFGGGRGHFLISAEHAYNDGIAHAYERSWFADHSLNWMLNPAYGTGPGQTTSVPEYIAMANVGIGNAAPGGLIFSGPLKGTQFLEGGTPAPFTFGSVVSDVYMSGGDWQATRIDADPMIAIRLSRRNVFTRATYDVSDDVEAFAEFHWSQTQTTNKPGVPIFRLGDITISGENPFIPMSVRSRMTELGLTNFRMGSTNADLPPVQVAIARYFRRLTAGFEGVFDAADTPWTWDAYVTHGATHVSARIPNNILNDRFAEAMDAVTDPATGRIVCRVALSNPATACVPYNAMGLNVNGAVVRSYFSGTGYSMQVIAQDVVAANFSGEPWTLPTGPVSLAFGVEHRRDSVKGIVSDADARSAWFVGNFKATRGHYSVTEGYVETAVPLANNTSWARFLDANAAVRATNYSESGYVTSWKVGATYSPFDGVMFRATRSRDIRAPNLSDLFNVGQPGTEIVIDRFRNNEGTRTVAAVEGNLDLRPEKAATTGLGMVFDSAFLPGFHGSIDYYNIDISGAIASLGAQQIIDRCFAGHGEVCAFIDRAAPTVAGRPGLINYVHIRPANVLSQQARGIDVEVNQTFSLDSLDSALTGVLQFRALATKVFRLRTVNFGLVQEGAGVLGTVIPNIPLTTTDLRYTASMTYTHSIFSGTLTMRGVGDGKYSNSAVVCTSACPVSTERAPTMNLNHIGAIRYFDTSVRVTVDPRAELFMVVENMFNRRPPPIYGSITGGVYAGASGAANEYDRQGRMFRAGVRFQM